MNRKTPIWIGVVVGSAIGGFLPTLWGDTAFSVSAVIFSTLGGLFGIFAGYKLGEFL